MKRYHEKYIRIALLHIEEGNSLDYYEREILYHYLQNEVINDEAREEITTLINIIGEDSNQLENKVNDKVLKTEGDLDKEIAMIEAYLYSGNVGPEVNDLEPVDVCKLRSYLAILNNYKKAITETKEEFFFLEGNKTDALLAQASITHSQESEPYSIEFDTEIAINIDESIISREEFLDLENPLLIRINKSEVVYYMGEDADMGLQHDLNEKLAEKDATNYLGDFIGAESFGMISNNLGKLSGPVNFFSSTG